MKLRGNVGWVNITVAATAHWLCVKHAPGAKIGNTYNIGKPTAYTSSALYLFSVHNIAPTYFCSNGDVMYNNKVHFFA
jgi:hypothetical protein